MSIQQKMNYSSITTLQKFKQAFGIGYDLTTLFKRPLQQVMPSGHLIFDLEEAKTYGLLSEKAKSEMIITPLLKEVRRNNTDRVNFLSGVALEISKPQLGGICDYVFSYVPKALELQAPIFCIVEAKNRTLEEGMGQCAAEMYASVVFNEEHGETFPYVYGAVTNAYDWVFLKLADNRLFIDQDRYGILNLPELLGVFQTIIDSYHSSSHDL